MTENVLRKTKKTLKINRVNHKKKHTHTKKTRKTKTQINENKKQKHNEK